MDILFSIFHIFCVQRLKFHTLNWNKIVKVKYKLNLKASELNSVKSNYILYGVNSLRLGGLSFELKHCPVYLHIYIIRIINSKKK